MDRRNGDPLAPPRPPKQIPRVHRPRAPEPETMMNEMSQQQQETTTSTAATQCTNINRQQQQQQQQLQQFGSSNNNGTNQPSQQQQQNHSITTTTTTAAAATTATTANLLSNHTQGSNTHPHLLSLPNVGSVSTVPSPSEVIALSASNAFQSELEDYPIHHLTYLPQRPSSLSRNSSHVSNASTSTSSSSITAAITFTRRRPPPLVPGAHVPLLTISSSGSSGRSTSSSLGGSNSNSNNISSSGGGLASLLSHFHSAEPAHTSSVTLAQPRPESERLNNEYVDTPLRPTTAQQLQLQHASRAQHPAGQHDNGQTTTHHLLLLPQRELRQQHQQQQHHLQLHQQHSSNRLAGTAGSATVTTGTDGTDGFLHSHNHSKSPASATSTAAATTTATTPLNVCPHTGKVLSAPSNGRSAVSGSGSLGNFANASTQPITQPITKQPALNASNTCKFAKDLPALDTLLDIHNISPGIQTPHGMVSAVNGASPLGTPIIIGGDLTGNKQLTCPHCGRCRCEHCTVPRPLPETWLCNKKCLCSAEVVIDYASCLCCAKALFYHCACDNDMDCDDSSGTPCVDNPCSCGPYKRTQRWGWLGALSIVLPCLWFYWPMRGCVALCEKCYDRYAGRRCRCPQSSSATSMLPIDQHGINGGSTGIGMSGGSMPQNGSTGSGQITTKSAGGSHHHHHHHHHNECSSVASRILRKGDATPEKRLLDSSPEY